MKKNILVLFVCLNLAGEAQAQFNFALNQIFRPNVRVRYQYAPTMGWADSTRFGYQQMSVAGIIPLGGGVQAKLKELKLQANQTFLNIQVGARKADVSHLKHSELWSNASIGVTHVRGRLGRGVWVYSAQMGLLADADIPDRRNFFGVAAVAKLQIMGLRKQNIYGVALAFSRAGVFPVPIFGWNRKLAKKWDIAILLPVQVGVSYRVNKKCTLEWNNTFSTVAFPLDAQQLRYSLPDAQWGQYLDVRSSLELTQKLNKNWQIIGEIGVTPYRSLQWSDNKAKTIQKFNGAAIGGFVTLGIRYSLPKGWLSAQMFEAD